MDSDSAFTVVLCLAPPTTDFPVLPVSPPTFSAGQPQGGYPVRAWGSSQRDPPATVRQFPQGPRQEGRPSGEQWEFRWVIAIYSWAVGVGWGGGGVSWRWVGRGAPTTG